MILDALTITAGTLDLDGNSLTISGNLTNSGTISNIDALTLNGSSAQTINFDVAVTVGSLTKSGAGTATLSYGLTVLGGATIGGGGLTGVSLSVDGSSSISADVTTTGNQTYGGTVTLEADGTDFVAGTNTVTFNNTVNGNAASRTLTVGNGSNATKAAFGGTVGGTLAGVRVYGASNVGADITTTGAQAYTGAVTLGDDVVLDSGTGNIGFTSTVNSSGAARSLELKAGTGTI
ncbi:MAG: hypothetical protein LBG26_07820, partial [Treponema sp.]|nr:hypothetical protein [Treponema sp.]